MRASKTTLMLAIAVIPAAPLAAQFPSPGGQECPAGTMLAPTAPSTGIPGMGGSMSPTGALASAAKKKLLGSKKSDPKADSAAAAAAAEAAKPRCLTPEQYTAEAKAQQSAAMKGAATAALSATPIGMAVVGARAAAPMAGKVAGALSNRFHRGPNKDNMTKALATGRLEVDNVAFDTGVDAPRASSEKSLAVLVDALKATEGQFIIRVTPESDGAKAADPKLAQRRAQLIAATLVQAGVPALRISAAPLTVTGVWDKGPPTKSEARLEIVSAAPVTPPKKQ